MSKIENIINALQECADGDNIIAFGFVCDITEQPAHAEGFAIGKPSELAECLAHLMGAEAFDKVITKAIPIRLKNLMTNLKEKDNESGHICLN